MATLTTNKNFLSPIGFSMKINSNKYANLEYYCVSATLPGFSLPAVDTPYKGTNLAFTGDRIVFEDLTLRVAITEDFENYIETFDWMHSLMQSDTPESLKEDGTLLILNSHNNVSKEIKFNSMFPTNIAGVEFNTQANDVEMVQCDISFAYTNFEFV